MSNTTTYSTIDDAHAAIVEALGEYADEYNTMAIAEHVFKWMQPTTNEGDVWLNDCGYQMKEEYADDDNGFWEMIEDFAIDTQDEDEKETEPEDDEDMEDNTTFYYVSLEEIAGSTREGLGEWADEYDVDAIVAEAYEWECVTEDRLGGQWVVTEGFRLKDKYDDEFTGDEEFCKMIENYKIDQNEEDEETEPQDEEETDPQLQNPFLDMTNAQILPNQK